MIPTNPLSGGTSPPTCSTDSDLDPIERQRYARQQLSQCHSDTGNTTQENHSSPLRGGEQNQAVLWLMPSYERTRSEIVLLETQKSPILPSKSSQANDFIPQIPLLSLLIRKKIHVSRTPAAERSLLPTSPAANMLPAPITPLLPRILLPQIPHPISVMGTIIHPPSTLSTPAVSLFHPLAISSLEAIFHIEDPQPYIPALVGIPLWMRQYSNNNNKNDTTKQEENEMVRQLWICANFDDPGFGTAPSQIGSKLVMRKDGVNLLPQHLEALCHFCIYVLQESCGGTGMLSSSPRKCEEQKQIFNKMATMRGFAGFWREYSEERGARDGRWKGLPSPYERGKLGMRYEWLVPTVDGDRGGERSVWEGDRVGETTRTEGLVTRELARRREAGCEADGRGRRKRELSEASSEESDIVPPSKRRRTGCSGKSVTRLSIPSKKAI